MNRAAWKTAAVLGGVAIAASAATFVAVRARAAGIPDPSAALTYTGYLENPDGTPLEGKPAIAVHLWADDMAVDPLCTGKLPADTSLQGGRFQVALPKACVDAVNANPGAWVDVDVDGNSLGRTKLGAVPYALQAGHASEADTAGHAADAAIVTEWKSYEATMITNGGAAVPGTTSTGRYRRVGDSIEAQIFVVFSQAPGSGAAYYQWALPTGLAVDFAKLPSNQAGLHVGLGFAAKANGLTNIPLGVFDRATRVSASAAGGGDVNDTSPFAFGTGDSMNIDFTVPIKGWTTTTP